MARDVVLYVQQPGSMDCTQTEEFLREMGVGFMVKNLAEDEEAVAELERMGTSTTPVTVAASACSAWPSSWLRPSGGRRKASLVGGSFYTLRGGG